MGLKDIFLKIYFNIMCKALFCCIYFSTTCFFFSFFVYLLYKNGTYLIHTYWWVWTYTHTHNTIATIKAINTFIIPQRVLVFLFLSFFLSSLARTFNWRSILINLKNFLFIEFREIEEVAGAETEREICCSIYLCIHWLNLVYALTGDQTYNLGVSWDNAPTNWLLCQSLLS